MNKQTQEALKFMWKEKWLTFYIILYLTNIIGGTIYVLVHFYGK